jgi:SpoVK/Ycf46/Vps4 family AAA+-type ATPase
MQSQLSWSDLVLNADVMEEVENIVTWLKQPMHILQTWGLEKSLKPGYRTLFYGPPGTGKTLTASLIGKAVNADVYRIDLSMLVSKYIGETEKIWPAFLTRHRTNAGYCFLTKLTLCLENARRRAAQMTGMRIRKSLICCNGSKTSRVIILATNLKANIDAAFSRRFQSEVYFAMPDAKQRERLWQGLFGTDRKTGTRCQFRRDCRTL